MACEYRRIVTGHTPEGKSTVLSDSSAPTQGWHAQSRPRRWGWSSG